MNKRKKTLSMYGAFMMIVLLPLAALADDLSPQPVTNIAIGSPSEAFNGSSISHVAINQGAPRALKSNTDLVSDGIGLPNSNTANTSVFTETNAVPKPVSTCASGLIIDGACIDATDVFFDPTPDSNEPVGC